jgi:hypothetical protein
MHRHVLNGTPVRNTLCGFHRGNIFPKSWPAFQLICYSIAANRCRLSQPDLNKKKHDGAAAKKFFHRFDSRICMIEHQQRYEQKFELPVARWHFVFFCNLRPLQGVLKVNFIVLVWIEETFRRI